MQVARLALLLPYVWYIVADNAHPLAIPRRDALAEAFVAGMVRTGATEPSVMHHPTGAVTRDCRRSIPDWIGMMPPRWHRL
jgi:hypothetical protein